MRRFALVLSIVLLSISIANGSNSINKIDPEIVLNFLASNPISDAIKKIDFESLDEFGRANNISCINKIIVLLNSVVNSETIPDDIANATPCLDILFSLADNYLNESNVKQQCREQIFYFVRSILKFNLESLWALKGNSEWIGDYHECMNIKETKWNGKYCYFTTDNKNFWPLEIKIFPLPFPKFQLGVCVPNGCNANDIANFYNSVLNPYNFNTNNATDNPNEFLVKTEEFVCTEPFEDVDSKAIVAIVILSTIVGFVLVGTIYDIFSMSKDYLDTNANQLKLNSLFIGDFLISKKIETNEEKSKLSTKKPAWKTLLINFSLISNFKKVFTVNKVEGQLDCLNGIRFLSMGWVVLGHMTLQFFRFRNSEKILTLFEWLEKDSSLILSKGIFAVDTFFLLSGLLTTYTFLKEMKKSNRKFSIKLIFMFYLKRILRITPPYMIMIMIYSCLIKYFESTPWYSQYVKTEQKICDKTWWYNLLYINNIFHHEPSHQSQCLDQAWYLGADMQFHIFAPFILIFLVNKALVMKLIGLSLLVAIWFQQVLTTALILNHYEGSEKENEYYTRYVSFQPYCRACPFVIGMLLGYILTLKSIKIKTEINLLLWSIALTFIGLMVFGINSFKNELSRGILILNLSTRWTVWSLGLAYIIYACVNSQGGIINKFLSLKIWVPLSRLSFSAYLVHEIVLRTYILGIDKPFYIQETTVAYLYISCLFLVCCVALIYSLLIEAPFMAIEKFIFSRIK